MQQVDHKSLLKIVEKGKTDPVLFARELLGVDLNVVQEKWLIETTKPGRKKNILVPANRVGKMNPLSEPVLTPGGFKPMGEIKVGSTVYADTGEKTTVIQVFPQGKQPIYKLTFDDGSWSRCGLDHLWKVMTPVNRFKKNFDDERVTRKRVRTGKKKGYPNNQYNQWSVMDTKSIIEQFGMNPRPGQRVAIPVTEPVQFDEKSVPIDPYVVGALIGDGSLSSGVVKVTSADKEIIESIRSSGFEVKQVGKSIDYSVYGIRPFLARIGLLGKRSWEKYIPKEYLLNSVENRIELLRGLMDTDGSISRVNRAMEYTTVSRQLADDVKFLVQSLGGKAYYTERKTSYVYKGKKRLGRTSYRVRVRVGINPFRLKRKANRFKVVTKRKDYRVLRKIEYVKDEEAQCIMVDHPTHTYLTREFIVTHNTFVCTIKHLWHLFYKPQLHILGYGESEIKDAKYPTLNISPNSSQTRVMFDFMIRILKSDFIWVDPDGTPHKNKCKIGWLLDKYTDNPMPIMYCSNGSIFYGKSIHDDRGKGIQGSEYAYISYDECPLSHHLKDEMGNLMSRLITLQGSIDFIGTPSSESPSNQFYMHIVKKGLEGSEGWYAMKGKLDDNKFLSEETRDAAKKMLKQTDHDQYRQVIFGEFTAASSGYFTPEQVEKLFKEGMQYEEPNPAGNYILAIDWAFAKNDYTVMIVIEFSKKPYRVVHVTRFQGHELKPQEQYAVARRLQTSYNAECIIDAQGGLGAVINEELADIVTHAFKFTGEMKKEMLLTLKEMLAVGDLVCPYEPELEEELGTYKEDDKRLTQDMVMALGMASWYIRENYTDDNSRELLEINLFQ